MRRIVRLSITLAVIWLVGLYAYALAVIASPKLDDRNLKTFVDSDNYWSPNPAFVKSEGKWDKRVWKWREFLGCGSTHITDSNAYNYSRWTKDHAVELGMLTPPDLDWVYVSGISVGSVWNDLTPRYQPLPLKINNTDALVLKTRIDEWKGAPLSPMVFPSWYAVLTDLWFNVTNVVIEGENGKQQFPSKILGIDVFYHTMTGGLNAAMGASNEFSRIEPCKKNFIYSTSLAGQDFYSVSDDGLFVVDLMTLLQSAQEQAAKKGWHFDIDNAELVMLESVVESYWSYAYAEITWTGVIYCAYAERHCAIE
ncbi:MAG: hypothetical protein ACE5J2_07735 [Nitrososphaerales archaeon]